MFFSQVMSAIGGNTAGPGTEEINCYVQYLFDMTYLDENSPCFYFAFIGDAVVNVYINHEKKFAFVEMRSVEEASNAMALDGIILEVLHSSAV